MLKILIVDSDFFQAGTCKRFMEKCECRAEIAPTGRDARRMMRAQSYDMILLDLDLSDGKADDMIPELRQIIPGINLVVMSSQSSRQREASIREQKIMYYLIKPFDEEELQEIVAHLAKKMAVDELRHGEG